ncbi:DCC1-like thiol-disulfide oxidoreductase family protein [Kitasatospora aureofaciens]|uniref:DCC1-like thiol-disulfide oxidoreductase family protein n=1 Tax=Kitasatospora aureofaciens TaxID=1894 RepID=UPI0033A2EA3D
MSNGFRDPVLIFDGDCPWCSKWVMWAMRSSVGGEAMAFQLAELPALDKRVGGWEVLKPVRCRHRLLWVTPRGRQYSGVAACARLLMRLSGPRAYLGGLLALQPVRALVGLAALPVVRYGHRAYRHSFLCRCQCGSEWVRRCVSSVKRLVASRSKLLETGDAPATSGLEFVSFQAFRGIYVPRGTLRRTYGACRTSRVSTRSRGARRVERGGIPGPHHGPGASRAASSGSGQRLG